MHESATATPAWVLVAYLIAGICFILALRGLSSPATSPSHFAAGLPAAAAAISAPTMITLEIALVTAISGVCSAGVTDQTTK